MIGKRSGVILKKEYPRDSLGFEDIDQFWNEGTNCESIDTEVMLFSDFHQHIDFGLDVRMASHKTFAIQSDTVKRGKK